MKTARLAGEVQSEGKPLAGAGLELQLLLGRQVLTIARSTSDPRGRYQFAGIPPGGYRLLCRAPGRATHQAVLWVEGRVPAPALDLRRAALVGGQAVDDRGGAVAGARVRVQPVAGTAGWSTEGRADARGQFLIDGLHPGLHQVTAEAPGYTAAVAPEVLAPAAELRLRLVRIFEIRGQVVGKAAARATVRLAGSGVWPPRRLTPAHDGGFVFPNVPAGLYELVAQVEGAPPASSRSVPRGREDGAQAFASEIAAAVQVGPESPAPVRLELRAVTPVRGVVVSGSKPVTGAVLSLGYGALSLLQSRTTSDAQGRFRFPPVAGGPLRLSAWAPGYLPQLEHELSDATAEQRIELTRGATLRGSVVDSDGRPVAGAMLWVAYRDRPEGGAQTAGELGVTTGPVPPIPPPGATISAAFDVGPSASSALSDGAGQFVLAGLRPGELRVTADHAHYARAVSPWIQLGGSEAAQQIQITLQTGGELGGRILDERGLPLEGVEVAASSGGDPRVTVSDRVGAYALRGLVGRTTVNASRRGYLGVSRVVRLTDGGRLELDLVLEPAQGRVTGTVRDPSRAPLAGARIQAVVRGRRLTAVSDPSGFFELEGVGTRPLTLQAQHARFASVERVVRPGDQVELQLGELAGLAGRVQDSRTAGPVSRFTVVVEGGGVRRQVAVQEAGGRFRVDGVPPGRASVRIDAPGYALRMVTARVETLPAGGRAEELEIALQPAGGLEGQLLDGSGGALVGATLGASGVHATSGAGGTFTLARVPEGTHVVEVRTREGRLLRSDPITVRAGDTAHSVRLVVR